MRHARHWRLRVRTIARNTLYPPCPRSNGHESSALMRAPASARCSARSTQNRNVPHEMCNGARHTGITCRAERRGRSRRRCSRRRCSRWHFGGCHVQVTLTRVCRLANSDHPHAASARRHRGAMVAASKCAPRKHGVRARAWVVSRAGSFACIERPVRRYSAGGVPDAATVSTSGAPRDPAGSRHARGA